METLMRLLKEGKLAKLCRNAAWVVAALGIVHIALVLYTAWQVNLAQQQQPGQIGPSYYIFDVIILPNISAILFDATTTIFYFVILYVLSAVLGTFVTRSSDITYQSLDDIEEDSSMDEETVRT
ncbi:MAG TPA: hypothetical protein VEV19_12985 [Ktedonobacteraceae bacterium]|nr:hypothetical protein [Ktedonobacteraceae bacterium]